MRCSACDARALSICSAVEDCDLHKLATAMQVGEAAAGQTFIDEGATADHFFNITAGSAKLFKLLPDGRRQITGFVGVGDFLGLAVSESYAFSAEALESVRFCRFPRTRLRTLLNELPAMERRLLRVASNELVAAQEQMLLLGCKTARERVASFLMARVGRLRGGSLTAALVTLPMTRGDIGDYLGLTIETVSRTLSRLKSDGYIAIEAPPQIRILQPQALRKIAGGFA